MPWKETTVDDERRRFIELARARGQGDHPRVSFAALCAVFGITTKTGYKYLQRYATEGEAGLQDRSRAPQHPRRTPEAIIERVLTAHHAHEDFGPVKLRQWLQLDDPQTVWPAASTIGLYLQRAGRTMAPTPPAIRVPGGTLTVPTSPNDVWGTDFKGWCRTGDGQRCEPWTLTDLCSRFLLGCVGLTQISTEAVRAGCEQAFTTYGLPAVIRTDNGAPFITSDRLGVSRLTVWWLKLGIRHERIRAGCPQQNGRHERFHRTLKAHTMCPPADTLAEQQQLFDRFATYYNTERPHAALGGLPPDRVYTPSPRPYTPVDASFEFTYPSEWAVRRVRSNGEVKWQGRMLFLSEVLIGEQVAFRPLTLPYWGLYVGSLPLAVWDSPHQRFLPRRRATAVLHLAELGQVQHGGPERSPGAEGCETVTDVFE